MTQERLFGALYASLENPETPSSSSNSQRATATATAAQSWLREIVYGGWDGLAYTRSLAEFVAPPHANSNSDVKKDEDICDREFLNANAALVEYIDAVLVDELTEGRHRAIEAALAGSGSDAIAEHPVVFPPTQLDLGSLISAPNELFDAENAWVGAGANEDSAVLVRALDHATHLLEQLQQLKQQQQDQHAQLAHTGVGAEGMDVDVKPEEEESTGLKERRDLETELRMNLIALAKRAPLDQIARMPSELVPPHLRHVVPTIGY